MRFFRRLFASRTDVYAIRWENRRTGRSGWVPAVEGGWRKGTSKPYLRLTDAVVEAHLTGEVHVGLYPMLRDDTCHWLAADFDGAVGDARRAFLPQGGAGGRRARRARGVAFGYRSARLGLLRRAGARGNGAHARLGAGAGGHRVARADGPGGLRSAVPRAGRAPAGGIGNLIAAPLQGRLRKDGATVFLDPGTLEPFDDQWAYLSSLHRLSPGEVGRLAARIGPVRVGSAVGGLREQTSSKIRPRPPATVEAVLGARVGIDTAALTPAMLATLKHAASMANPAFYDRQRRRMSTWGVPRFLHSFDETLDGRLVLPRGLARCRRHRGRGSGEHPGDRR